MSSLFTRQKRSIGLAYPLPGGDTLLAIDAVNEDIQLDTARMAATAIISTESFDRDGDIVEQAGLDFENYSKNPVVFFNHQAWPLPIGKSEDEDGCLTVRKHDRYTTATCYFSQNSPQAEQIYHLVADKTLRGTSIGFLVKRALPLQAAETLGMARLTNRGRDSGYRIQAAEVTEWSWVGIGANPDAVLVHLQKGLIAGRAIDERLKLALEPYAAKMHGGLVTVPAEVERIEKSGNYDPDKQPRGQPDNAGQFASKPGTGSSQEDKESQSGESDSRKGKEPKIAESHLPVFEPATANSFLEARSQSAKQGFLSAIRAEDLANHKLLLSKDGRTGVAVSSAGDIQNVFNNGVKGGGEHALLAAIRAGGRTLDCYDGFLPGYYGSFGFTEAGRMKFDDDHAPEGWDFEANGRPDIVFMARTVEVEEKTAQSRAQDWKKERKNAPKKTTRYFEGSQWDDAKTESARIADEVQAGSKRDEGTKAPDRDREEKRKSHDRNKHPSRDPGSSSVGNSARYGRILRRIKVGKDKTLYKNPLLNSLFNIKVNSKRFKKATYRNGHYDSNNRKISAKPVSPAWIFLKNLSRAEVAPLLPVASRSRAHRHYCIKCKKCQQRIFACRCAAQNKPVKWSTCDPCLGARMVVKSRKPSARAMINLVSLVGVPKNDRALKQALRRIHKHHDYYRLTRAQALTLSIAAHAIQEQVAGHRGARWRRLSAVKKLKVIERVVNSSPEASSKQDYAYVFTTLMKKQPQFD